MQVKVQRMGNSLGVRIPAPVLKALGLAEGNTLHLDVAGETIVLSPAVADLPSYTLAELAAQAEQWGPAKLTSGEWLDRLAKVGR